MKRLIAPGVNCWQAFLAAMLDVELNTAEYCSTVHDNWEERTDEFLHDRGLMRVQILALAKIAPLPDGALVGAILTNSREPHIVIAKTHRWIDGTNTHHYFTVEHDPSGKNHRDDMCKPESIVLLCKLIK